MKTRMLTVALAFLAVTVAAVAQGPPASEASTGNPLGRDPAAVKAGDGLFHERCAVCHGQKAEGSMAANLVQTRTVRRGAPKALFELIRKGIPGTDMPPQPDWPDESIWQVISYLRSLALPGEQPPLAGDVDAGRAVFRQAGCINCHIVNGSGGFFGPSLDSIAVRKASGKIRSDVLEPDAEQAAGFRSVAVETREGSRVEGVLKNEDTFQILVLTQDGDIKAFQRSKVKSVSFLPRSRMPADYEQRLSPDELQNLLAFLDRQRDPFTPVRRGFAVY